MMAITAQMDANSFNRTRLEEVLELISSESKRGKYSKVVYLSPLNTDQTVYLTTALKASGFSVVESIFKHKAIVCWTPEEMKKSLMWKFRRVFQFVELL
jgi:hypothetical protein